MDTSRTLSLLLLVTLLVGFASTVMRRDTRRAVGDMRAWARLASAARGVDGILARHPRDTPLILHGMLTA